MDSIRQLSSLTAMGLLLLLLLQLQITTSSFHGPAEYCQWEEFNAKCAEDEMVVFSNAVYGRMHLGRCVNRDFGFIGCGTNVLPTMHRECSGRRECEFGVTNLHGNHDCSNDLTAYLAASYECVKVVSCERKMCDTSDYLKVAAPSGYLSSEVTYHSGCGTASCPWVIQALPGQKVNLTLMDFSGGHNRLTTGGDPRKACYRYATLREANTITRDLTICVGDERKPTNQVYTSETGTVSVTLYTAETQEELFYFALKYETLGCPTLTPPKNSWVKHIGDEVIVYCNATKREWRLHCAGTSWIGEVGDCHGEAWGIQPLVRGDSPAFGMLVIIGMGVAIGVVIGGLLLAVTLIYLKRRNQAPEIRSNPLLGGDRGGLYVERVPRYDQHQHDTDHQNQKNTLTVSIKQETEHDYTCTLPYRHTGRDPRSPRLTTFPATDINDSGVESSAEFAPVHEFSHVPREQAPHVYESPQFPLQAVPVRGARTQSADGISRKIAVVGRDEGSSNRTN